MPEDPNQSNGEAQAEKRLGKTMLYVGWVVALGVLVSLFSGVENSQRNPNRSVVDSRTGGTEVVLKSGPFGQYVFTGLANGEEIDFLVDTGASYVVFTEKQAKKLGLRKGLAVSVRTANGTVSSYVTNLSRLNIGGIVLHDVPAHINPHMDGDALLGMSALQALEWRQVDDQLILKAP